MRDPYMAEVGLAVLRFLDREVLNNLDAVLEEVWRQL
jgi:very-short-patch-repair endonuclease